MISSSLTPACALNCIIFWTAVFADNPLFKKTLDGKSAVKTQSELRQKQASELQQTVGYKQEPKKNKTDFARELLIELLKKRGYNRNIRPVKDYDKPVVVAVGLNLYQILRVMWDDAYLGWDPAEYGGINWTTLPYSNLWRPDTCVYNSIVTKENYISIKATTSAIDPNATLPYVAHIRFMYPAIYQFSCNLEVKYFPFDRQNCSMFFGSWTLDGAGIDYQLHMDTVRFEYYVPNEEWSVISFKMVRQENWYTCCPFPYTELHAHLVIQRKPLYYIVNLVIPIIIIAVIAAFGFFTPVSSGGERTERVELGVNTLLAMSILLVIVADQMPTTSNSVPLISWFYLINIILIAAGTVLASVVMIIQQQGHYGKQLPEGVKRIFFKGIGPALCIYPLKMPKRKTRYFHHNPGNNNEPEEVEKPLIQRGLRQASHNLMHIGPAQGSPRNYGLDNAHKSDGAALVREVRNIKNILYALQESQDIHDHHAATKTEWEYLAVILDRALLLVFMALLIGFTAIFFSYGFSLLNQDDDPATIHW